MGGERPTDDDQLWAPWRMEYILRNKDEDPRHGGHRDDGCFLCRFGAAPTTEDAGNHVVLRGERAFVVLNRFPYNNGHLLVAPLDHLADLTELDDETLCETTLLLRRMVAALREAVSPDGFNVGLNLGRVAGAGLPGHLHWHVVPRWSGDTNFMPVVGNVDVIPQSLQALHTLLSEHV